MASGMQSTKEEDRKENGFRLCSEPAVFVTKVVKKKTVDFLV